MSTNNKNVGKALTLEQLRKMNDQPVKVKNLEFDYGGICTGVVTMSDPNESENGVDVGCSFYCIKDYGKTWIAYSYQPVHIDLDFGRDTNVRTNVAHIVRDAWKPCEWCEEYGDSRFKLYAGYCMQKAADDIYEEETEDLNYCPKCGRPLTEEAWAELEKRLRG